MKPEMENDELQAFRNGDQSVFRAVFKQFYARLLFFANGFVLDEAEAEDVLQEVFLKLWERRENFDNIQSIKAFLYLSVKNSCCNISRRKQVVDRYNTLVLPEAIENDNMLSRMIEAEVVEEVFLAVQKLPKGSRQVVNLAYFQGLSNQEAANVLEISINTVKTQKMRALDTLRKVMMKMLFLLP